MWINSWTCSDMNSEEEILLWTGRDLNPRPSGFSGLSILANRTFLSPERLAYQTELPAHHPLVGEEQADLSVMLGPPPGFEPGLNPSAIPMALSRLHRPIRYQVPQRPFDVFSTLRRPLFVMQDARRFKSFSRVIFSESDDLSSMSKIFQYCSGRWEMLPKVVE